MKESNYVYYQPNSLSKKDKHGDCVIRALSKVLDITWKEAFEKTLDMQIKWQCPINGFPLELYKKLYTMFFLEYKGISNKKGSYRPTVREFAESHPKGKYILNVAHHQVAVVDGKYYDTFDCGYKSLYGYWTLNEK